MACYDYDLAMINPTCNLQLASLNVLKIIKIK